MAPLNTFSAEKVLNLEAVKEKSIDVLQSLVPTFHNTTSTIESQCHNLALL